MALANCARCNKVFNKVSSPLCPACLEQEEHDFQVVSAALREQPGQTVEQLAQSTGVNERTILRLIKNERIASDAYLAGVKCGRCGAPAMSVSTRLCARCAAEMSRAAALACSRTGQGNVNTSAEHADESAENGEESVHETLQRKTGRI